MYLCMYIFKERCSPNIFSFEGIVLDFQPNTEQTIFLILHQIDQQGPIIKSKQDAATWR